MDASLIKLTIQAKEKGADGIFWQQGNFPPLIALQSTKQENSGWEQTLSVGGVLSVGLCLLKRELSQAILLQLKLSQRKQQLSYHHFKDWLYFLAARKKQSRTG